MNYYWKKRESSLRMMLIYYLVIWHPIFYLRNLSIMTSLAELEIRSFNKLNFPELINSFKNVYFFFVISFRRRVEMLLKLVCLLYYWCSFYFEKHVMYYWDIALILRHSSAFKLTTGWQVCLLFGFGKSGNISFVFGEIYYTFGLMGSDNSSSM